MRGSRRGDRVSGPPEKSENIGLLSNDCSDPLKNHKATKPALMLGHHRPAGETPFKWRFAGGPMMACFLCFLGPLYAVRNESPLAKLSGTANAHYMICLRKNKVSCFFFF